MADIRERIVKRVAGFFKDGDLVNLGIGMPTMVANYIPDGINILLQSENGFTGIGPSRKRAWRIRIRSTPAAHR
jgi:acetate CoA/acetoacetate CoA-transferase beta subunit